MIPGLNIAFDTILTIDVIPLFQYINKYNRDSVLEYITINIPLVENIIINVGKISISNVEKNTRFIKELSKRLYNIDHNITSCQLINTPKSFTTIFSIIKPFLTKDALKIISINNIDLKNIKDTNNSISTNSNNIV